ncbi:MAG: efflux RND transporter periplasmic adaptor subunit [Myxococcota bacterium]
MHDISGRRIGLRLPPYALWLVPGLVACGGPVAADQGTEADAPPRIEVVEVRAASAEETLVLHGTVRAADRANLAFAVGGRLLQRPVEVGDRVEAGQMLARVDARPFRNAASAARAQIAELDAQAAQLARDEERVAALEASGAASAAAVEQSRTGTVRLGASRDASIAQLAEARRQVGEAVLRAPYAGVVRAVFAEPGTVVAPGTPVLALAGEAGLEVEAEVPEPALAWLREGLAASVEIPATGARTEGRVLALARAAGPSGLFPLRLRLEGVEAFPGQGALLRFARSGVRELRVPLGAVLDPSGEAPEVWKVRDGSPPTVERVAVRVRGLREAEGRPEVALPTGPPLQAGDRVVVRGQRPLLDGDVVRLGTARTEQARAGEGDPR